MACLEERAGRCLGSCTAAGLRPSILTSQVCRDCSPMHVFKLLWAYWRPCPLAGVTSNGYRSREEAGRLMSCPLQLRTMASDTVWRSTALLLPKAGLTSASSCLADQPCDLRSLLHTAKAA